VRRTGFALLLWVPLGAAWADEGTRAQDCRGETLALAPLEPLAVAPALARELETQVRDALQSLSAVCLLPRAHSAERLRALEHHRVRPCTDAACRAEQVKGFEADWLMGGVVYGLGGGRTVNLFLWSADGSVVQHGSFAGQVEGDVLGRMLREARLGRSLVEEPAPPLARVRRADWVPWALAGAAATAVAVGGGFGSASLRTAGRVSAGATGCPGEGLEYQRCFEGEVQRGRTQARTANVLFGAGAALGAAATVSLVVEWP
jgi:hypothetical protein